MCFSQLPQKVDHVVFCPLTEQQIEVYKRILEIDEVKNMTSKDDPCNCGSRKPFVFLTLVTEKTFYS